MDERNTGTSMSASLRKLAFDALMLPRKIAKDLLLFPPGYSFKAAKSVTKQIVTADYNGTRFTFEADYTTPLYDMVAEIIDYDCYQLSSWKGSEGSDNAVILDIGANVGVFSIVAGAGYKGQVHAFEPIQNNRQQLQRNLEINNLENVVLMPYAVGCRDGNTELVIEAGQSVSARAPRYRSDRHARRVNAQVRSLGRVLQELDNKIIDLIKMDCEGCEHEILRSLSKEDVKKVRAMTFEIHTDLFNWKKGERNRQVRSVIDRLHDWGFQTTYKPEMFGRRELHHLLATR